MPSPPPAQHSRPPSAKIIPTQPASRHQSHDHDRRRPRWPPGLATPGSSATLITRVPDPSVAGFVITGRLPPPAPPRDHGEFSGTVTGNSPGSWKTGPSAAFRTGSGLGFVSGGAGFWVAGAARRGE